MAPRQKIAVHYDSEDVNDETVYNSFTNNKERLAFIKEREISDQGRATNNQQRLSGNEWIALWKSSKHNWIKKWGKKSSAFDVHKPANPPLAPPPPPPPIVLPTANVPPPPQAPPTLTQSGITATSTAPIPTPASATETPGPRTPPMGPTRLDPTEGELSPITILRNDPKAGHYLSPTLGSRHWVHTNQSVDPEIMPNAKWVFVRTVYQTKVDKDAQEGEVIMPPKSVSLFVLVDGNGIIQDQMAVKSVDTSTDVGQEGMELEIQWNKIVRQIRCSHVLRYRGFSDREFYLRIRQEHKKRDSGKGKGSATSIGRDEDPPSRKYRITYLYTDFCERGDLADLINRYRLPNKGNNFIPEQYIWYTLEQCAAAFSALQNGKCASPIEDVIAPDKDDKDKAKEWDALVHRDVKSLNILLGSPDEQYPSYARVLLADFDSVEYESRLAENPNDPDNWRYGTQDWLPPEKHEILIEERPIPTQDWPITIKSDVWSLGLVALHVMLSGTQHYTSGRFKADMREECEQWDTDPRERERTYCIPQSTEDEIPSYYSDHLFTWVKLMLSYDYTKRPTPGKIQRVAKRALHISFPHENESFSKGNTFEHSKKRKLEKMFQEEENIYYDLEQGQQTYTTLLRAWDSGLNSTNYEKDDFAGALQMFDVTNVTIAEDTVPHKDDTESGSTAVVLRGLEILRKRIEPGAVHTTYLGSHGDMQDPRRRKALTYPEDKFNFFSALNDRVKQLLETNPALSEVLEVMRHGNYMGTSFLLMGTVPDMGSRVFSHWHEAIFDVVRWMPSGTFD